MDHLETNDTTEVASGDNAEGSGGSRPAEGGSAGRARRDARNDVELPKPLSEGRPSAEAAEKALVRKPKIGDPRTGIAGAGRDHWTHCLTDVLAGGGIRGGQVYGSSDRRGEFPADRPVTPAHVTKTVYHAMGIHDLEAIDPQGRPYNLLSEGQPLVSLF